MFSDRGHDARWQQVVNCIDANGPDDVWKKHAKMDATIFYDAAMRGTGPGMVNPDCGKCKKKAGVEGHWHSVLCKKASGRGMT